MKVFWNKELADPAGDPAPSTSLRVRISAAGSRLLNASSSEIPRFVRDFGSGLPLRSRPLNASSLSKSVENGLVELRGRLIGRAHYCLLHSEATLLQSTGCMSVTVLTGCL